MTAILIITTVISLIALGVLMAKYLDGDFDIESREIIKSETYNVSYRYQYSREFIPFGQETQEVHKITYRSGRIKYKTYSFKH
jgi:DNA-dependent RNA polymerase auxiliary subunit epsilon